MKAWILETISKRKPSIYAYSILVDICELQIEEGDVTALSEALNYCSILREDMDVIRKEFWRYTGDRLNGLVKSIKY